MSTVRGVKTAWVAAIAMLIACSEEGPTGAAGAIEVATDVTALSVPRGGSGAVTVTLTRSGGFGGDVTLSVSGFSADITVTTSPSQLSGATSSATINLNVATTAALLTHNVTITAWASGVAMTTAQFALTVTPVPSFGLRVTPLAVAAGSSGTVVVNIDRTAFTGGVAFSLLNAPAGITAVFNPTTSTTDVATLGVNVASNVAAGIYQLMVQGTAAVGVQQAAFTLTVTPAMNSVEYHFCSVDDAPMFFAYQDGAGVWQALTHDGGDMPRYQFNITQGRGAVLMIWSASSEDVQLRRRNHMRALTRMRSRAAMLRGVDAGTVFRAMGEDLYETFVLYASASELARDGVVSCEPEQPTRTVHGVMTGVPAGMYGFATFGSNTEIAEGGAINLPVTFHDVRPGTLDLIAVRARPGQAPDRMILVRDVNVADGATLPFNIDFNGTLAMAPATANATIAGGNGEDLEVYTGLVTRNGLTGIWSDLAPSTTSVRPWAGVAPASLNAGDFHSILVFGSPVERTGNFRVTGKYVGTVGEVNLALGPPIVMPTMSQVGSSLYPRLRFQGTLAPDYHKILFVDVTSEAHDNLFVLISTGAYLTSGGNTLTYDLSMPDVETLAGFPVASRLAAGLHHVSIGADGFEGPGIYELIPTPGTEFRGANMSGTFVVR